ncbi:hypothetical protein WMF27_09545 [Sorangium sp. So ce281]
MEDIGVGEPEVEGLPPAHRQAGDDPRIGVGGGGVSLLDPGDQVVEQDVPEVREAREIVSSVHLAAGHHDDHGFGHLLRVQIVHDIVGIAFVAPLADPGDLIAADSMMQVNDRVFWLVEYPGGI